MKHKDFKHRMDKAAYTRSNKSDITCRKCKQEEEVHTFSYCYTSRLCRKCAEKEYERED